MKYKGTPISVFSKTVYYYFWENNQVKLHLLTFLPETTVQLNFSLSSLVLFNIHSFMYSVQHMQCMNSVYVVFMKLYLFSAI